MRLLLACVILGLLVCALVATKAPHEEPLQVKTIDPREDIAVVRLPPKPSSTTTTVARHVRVLPPTTIRSAPSERTAPAVVAGAWSCGGSLPPCYVLNRENPNRDLTVYNGGSHHPVGYTGGNPEGDSTASGKWQFLRSTWANFRGYVNAADAPWQVQDEKARLLWADGAGCSHWKAC